MTMTSTSTAVSTPVSRDETGRLLGQTMGLVALTAGVFSLGAPISAATSRAGGRSPSRALIALIAFGIVLLFVEIPDGALIYAPAW